MGRSWCVCLLALGCLAFCVEAFPLAEEGDPDNSKSASHTELLTQELERLLVRLKKRAAEGREITTTPTASDLPMNVVLVMSRDPYLSGGNDTANLTRMLEGFPVKGYVQDRKQRTPEEPLLLVSPKLLPRQGSYDVTHSCKAALDTSIAALLETARTKRHMATGYLVMESMTYGEPFFPLWDHRAQGPEGEEGEEELLGGIRKRSPGEQNPINDKFQRLGGEDRGSGILYKKVEIGGGAEGKTCPVPASKVKAVGKRSAPPGTAKPDSMVDNKGPERVSRTPDAWEIMNTFNQIRRSIINSFLRGLGLARGFDGDGNEESQLAGLVDNTLTDLAKEGEHTGYILVVSGSDKKELKDVLKVIRAKTNPKETLVAVTGNCPDPHHPGKTTNFWQYDGANKMDFSNKEQKIVVPRHSDPGKISLFATGPGSERLNQVKTLWEIPEFLLNITSERPLVNFTEHEQMKNLYGYKPADKKNKDPEEPFLFLPVSKSPQKAVAEHVREADWFEDEYENEAVEGAHRKNSEMALNTGKPPPKDARLGDVTDSAARAGGVCALALLAAVMTSL